MLVKQLFISIILILACFTSIAQEKNENILFEDANYRFPYSLGIADTSWTLPGKLVEISGLSYIDDRRMACVQDEKGNVYIFNLISGEIELKVDFGADGDYEGIEIVDNDAWVLKSNGTLFQVSDYLKLPIPFVKKHATVLSGKNDAEGIAYDPLNHCLLIACKGHPFVEDKKGNFSKARSLRQSTVLTLSQLCSSRIP